MNKNRINKNDRKRQRRKDFSNGRYRNSTPQDQRSTYPKSSLALRADAARRAQLAGLDPSDDAADYTFDLSPGAVNYQNPGITPAMIKAMRDMQLADITKMMNIGPPVFVFPNVDFSLDFRPDLRREMQVGEILAHRCWRLTEDGLLHSVYVGDPWHPREIMVGRGIEDWSERGVHAWKDLNSPQFNNYVRGYLGSHDPYDRHLNTIIVTGKVHLWGDVVEHEHGYRAEYAKIISLDWLYPNAELMGREQKTLNYLRMLYGVQ